MPDTDTWAVLLDMLCLLLLQSDSKFQTKIEHFSRVSSLLEKFHIMEAGDG
jgi:hypothetical protein